MTDATDLEERLTAALARGADQAPGAAGLAGAARRRARTRRRRVTALGAVAAVLVVAASVAVVQWPQDGGPAPSTGADDAGWRTVELDLEPIVLVDLPAGWVELAGCDSGVTGYGPDTASCGAGEGMTVVPESDGPVRPRQERTEAGWVGNVSLGTRDFGFVRVRSDDEQRMLQVLGSVRWPDEQAPEVGAPWPLVEQGRVAYRVPSDPTGIDVTVTRTRAADGSFSSGPVPGGWRTVYELQEYASRVEVTAPTQALAEVVAGSARGTGDATIGWTTLTVRDVDLDVPSDWDVLDTSGCEVDVTAFGPPGTDPCGVPYPLAVYGSSTFDPALGPGLVRSNTGWGGYVLTGDAAFTVDVTTRGVARRVLASVRPAGDPAPDVARWRRVGVAEVPGDERVHVKDAITDQLCGHSRGSAEQRPDGVWQVEVCIGGLVYVEAPTQALADVVASTIPLG